MLAEPSSKHRSLLIKAAVGLLVLGIGVLLLARGVDLRGRIDQGMALIRDAGPVVFFTAMALLPCLGVPMLAFTLTAGSAFGPRYGMPLVLTLALLGIMANFSLTYALARWALRPPLTRLIARLGYKMPVVESGDMTDLIVIVRVSPMPFFVQNYVLGLANAPFGRYFLISAAITGAYTTGFVLFGDALLNGRGRMAMIGFSVIAAAGAGTHMLKRHYGRRKP